jgi:NMD protein affecting ribosome stability and mRNA decay
MYQSRYRRLDRLTQQKRNDAYVHREKWPEPTVCTQCHSLFTVGRWTWGKTVSNKANQVLCPACRRINDDYPAGIIELSGSFLAEHKEEILNLAHNEETFEKNEHPMERIIKIVEEDEGTTISTTGIHLARRLGEAIHHAYQGDYDHQYLEDENFVRISWER